MARTLQDVLKLCEEKEVKIVDFKMTDIDGRWRHLSIPVERLNEDTMIYGIGFDGSNYGYAPVESSDMVFVPDLDSATIDPFSEVPTLTMIGDVMIIDRPENRPFDQYPRNVTKRAIAYMKEQGVADTMIVGPEYEFYIFDNVEFSTRPEESGFSIEACQAEWSTGNNGYQVRHKAGYHTSLPLDVNQDLRNRMCLLLEDWGVKVKYHHRTATFMPKPVAGEAGSGMHVHMHLFKDGEPIFYDEKNYAQLSDQALWFIGGMLTHASSLCALTNPSTNSYKRLVPGFEAPVTVGYAMANRSAVVRIPAYAKAPKNKRFELRNPDGTCNPYYAFAAILMAGLDGIKNKIDPHEKGWGPYDFNLYTLSEEEKAQIDSLPKTLDEALDALEADHDYLTAGGVFPERLIEIWIERKRGELDEMSKIPTPVEFSMYYDL